MITDAIGRSLADWVRWELRFPRTVVASTLLLAIACVTYAAGNLGINTDTADMISDELPWRQQFIDYRNSFPVRDRNLVAVVDGESAWATDDFARRLAAALREQPELFSSVFLPGDGPFFARNGLLYLTQEQLDELADRLVDAQPLIGYIAERGDGAAVIEVVARAVQAESPNGPELAPLYSALADALTSADTGSERSVDWESLLRGAPVAEQSILLIQPALDFDRVQPARPAIDRLRSLAEQLQPSSAAPIRMRLTGTLAMEHEELGSVSRGAGIAGVAALFLVVIVLIWSLRSLILLAISIAVLLIGLCGTATFAAAAVGHLNLLSVAFAVLYVGLGVDFILHICLRTKELIAGGHSVDDALIETMNGVGASLVICAFTTAAGFYSFVPTQFDGVSELGLISGTGMFISLAVSVVLLPALIKLLYRPRSESRATQTLKVLRTPSRALNPRLTLLAAGAVLVGAAFELPRVSFDSNPVNLRDPQSESVELLRELAASNNAELASLVAVADDAATAASWAAALRSLNAVGSVATVESMIPQGQSAKLTTIDDLALILGGDLGGFETRPTDPERLRAALRSLRDALRAARPLDDAAESLAAAVDLALADGEDRDASAFRAIGDRLLGNLPQALDRLALAMDPQPVDRSNLPPELTERWIDADGRELIEIVPADNSAVAGGQFVDAVRAVLPNATGLPVVHREASRTVVASFEQALLYALVLVTIILLTLLRSLRDTAMILGPIIFAAIVTAGATVWMGIPFNFANIIALPLLVGVGVDNGIHMVYRMRTEPPPDREPLSTSTSRAVLGSGLTTIASFGNLAFSAHVGMASMGKLLTLGMVVTLVATLVILPAVFRLADRR